MNTNQDVLIIKVDDLTVCADSATGNVFSMFPVQIEGSPTIAELPTLYPSVFYSAPLSPGVVSNSNIYAYLS